MFMLPFDINCFSTCTNTYLCLVQNWHKKKFCLIDMLSKNDTLQLVNIKHIFPENITQFFSLQIVLCLYICHNGISIDCIQKPIHENCSKTPTQGFLFSNSLLILEHFGAIKNMLISSIVNPIFEKF